MKKNILTTLLLGCMISLVTRAQEEQVMHPVLDQPAAVGIFTTFEQLKNNTPDPEYKLNIDPAINMERANAVESIKGVPVITSSGEKTLVSRAMMFGYCDGVDIYVSCGFTFCKIEDPGVYSVFTPLVDLLNDDYRSLSTSSQDYILDMNSGKTHLLNKRVMKKVVLIDYPDLLEKFNNDKMKSTMMRWYVTEANKRAKK